MQTIEPRQDFSETLLQDILRKQPAPVPSPARRWSFWHSRWAPASLLVVALLGLLAAVGPYRVVAALQALIGYIPGIGFVEDSAETLYLAQPLVSQQAGFTLTVDQVVADSEHTVVAYHLENMPVTPEGETVACVYDDNKIRLPDGKVRPPIGGSVSGDQARIEYQPLPKGVEQFTLLVAMNWKDERCQAPESWAVDIRLGSIPPQVTVMPVYEGAQIQASVQTATPLSTTAGAQEISANAIQFEIDRVAELDNGYFISGHGTWNDPAWERVEVFPDVVHLVDADGKTVPLEPSDEANQDGAFSYKLSGKNWRSPLTLKIDSLWVHGTPTKTYDFSFDAGSSPKQGQSWELNQKLDVMGQPITLRRVMVTQLEDGATGEKTDGYAFDLEIPEGLNLIGLIENEPRSSVSQSKNASDGHQILEVGYPDGLPGGKLTYHIQYMDFNLNGNWQTDWVIPATSR